MHAGRIALTLYLRYWPKRETTDAAVAAAAAYHMTCLLSNFMLPCPISHVRQAVSMLLDDPVSFRYQWPRNAELKVNQMGYRVYSRQANSKVGNNTRDEPANLATTVFAGLNRVRLKVVFFPSASIATTPQIILLVRLAQCICLQYMRSEASFV